MKIAKDKVVDLPHKKILISKKLSSKYKLVSILIIGY
jgi:hypothetical protein